jgi:hypothetical protein
VLEAQRLNRHLDRSGPGAKYKSETGLAGAQRTFGQRQR